VDRNVMLNYSSTLDGSVLLLTCENKFQMPLNSTNETTLNVTCHSNRSWIPNPAEFTCSSSTTVLPGMKIISFTKLIAMLVYRNRT
jgi:hypothetical protein